MKVKGLLFIAVILLGWTVTAKTAWAVFSIDIDTPNIDFGVMNIGDQRSDVPARGVVVTCASNQGNLWKLNVYAQQPFTHENNSLSIIPNSDFYWFGVNTNGSGILKKIAEDFTFEKTVYEAGSGEGSPPVSIEVRFRLDVRDFIQSGGYQTRVIFTMFE